MKQAGVKDQICRIVEKPGQSNILLYPIAYRRCTVYTFVNEGDSEDVAFTDLASGVQVKVGLQANRGAKLWLDREGNTIGAYLNAPATVGKTSIQPNGDLALFRGAAGWTLMPGRRDKGHALVDSTKIPIGRDRLFQITHHTEDPPH
jgi:hypothetical protein